MARFIGTKHGVLDTRHQRLSLVLPAPKDTRKREDTRKTSAVDFNVTHDVGGAL